MTRRRMLLAASLVLAACGMPASSPDPSPSSSAPAPPTGSPSASGQSPPGVVHAYRFDPSGSAIPPVDSPDGAGGSGCQPGDGPLPDGAWFGIVWEAEAEAVTFDLACWYSGEAATRAYAEDGYGPDSPPNDYYVRNQADTLRTIPLAVGAVIHAVTEPGQFEATTIMAWPSRTDWAPCPGQHCIAWLYVNEGMVTEIAEQWVP